MAEAAPLVICAAFEALEDAQTVRPLRRPARRAGSSASETRRAGEGEGDQGGG
jgi:hypothetical protein